MDIGMQLLHLLHLLDTNKTRCVYSSKGNADRENTTIFRIWRTIVEEEPRLDLEKDDAIEETITIDK
ncbi:hypothetical protein KIN20_006656 [Parelaphostrongylus tenuis]|uniref:Uncharacterized protein n=1 Tax=Parelaphostrongylus tenuis TaxID=148309 RepID=A0AAD5M6E9_PARTN|nr:hypothetical protein KIN20_006656 [Parelaphostrongylus tenuis]